MNKAMIMVAVGLLLSGAVQAQKIEEGKVSAGAKNGFAKAFPGVKAKWEKENGDFEAGFTKDGKKMSAVFTADGIWKETETAMAASALPKTIQQYVKKNYPAEKVKEGAEIKKADGTVLYEAEIKGKDLVFDANGTFIKTSKD